MDVQLPDGTTVQGVPDGTTKAMLAEKLQANGRTVPKEWLSQEAPKESHGFVDTIKELAPNYRFGRFFNETIPNRMLDVEKATLSFDESGAYDKEAKRREAAGEPKSVMVMEKWKNDQINKIIQDKKGPHTDASYGQMWEALKGQIKTDPGKVGAQILFGLAEEPEMAFLPEFLPVRVAKIAMDATKVGNAAVNVARIGKAAYVATEALQTGAVVAGEGAVTQLAEKGEVNPKQVAFDLATMAAPVVGVKSIVAVARKAGKELAIASVAADVAKEIKAGASATDAVIAVAKKHMPDDVAEDIGEKIKPEPVKEAAKPEVKEPEHAPEKGKVEEGGQQQYPGTETQRIPAEASSGDKPIEPEKVSEKVKEKEKITQEIKGEGNAVVSVGGHLYAGPVHGVALNAAIKDGVLRKDAQGQFFVKDKSTGEWRRFSREAGDDNGLFRNPDGTLRERGKGEKAENTAEGKAYKDAQTAATPKAPAKKVVKPPVEQLPRATAESVLHDAGLMPDEITDALGKGDTVPNTKVDKALKKIFGDQKYIDQFLSSRKGQSGKIDPELLVGLGLATAAGGATYALTGDKADAVAAAVAAGALPYARNVARRMGQSAAKLADFAMDKRINPKEVWRDFKRDVGVPEYANRQWQKTMEAMLPKEGREQAYVRIRDYMQGHRDVALTPNELAAAEASRKFLDFFHDKGMKGNVLHSYLEDYLPGIYQKPSFKTWSEVIDTLVHEEARLSNVPGMRRSTRHAMEKIIPDYRTVERLVKEGKLNLVPLTNNPFEMSRLAANSVNKAVQVNKLINTLKDLKDGSGTPLILGHSPAMTQRTIKAAIDKMGTDLGTTDKVKDLWSQMELQRSAKDYVTINHPSLAGLKVHRDLAGPLKMLFDTSDPQSIGNAIYRLSMAHKSLLFTTSLFHASTLAAVAAPVAAARAVTIAAQGLRPRFWGNVGKAWEANAGKEFSPVAAKMIETGATLGHGIQDVDPSFLQRTFNLVQNKVGKVPGVGKYLEKGVGVPKFVHKAIQDFIFEKLQPTLKMATWMAEEDLFRAKNPKATPEQLLKAQREISDGVNTLYGGLNWFELANNVGPQMARTMAMTLFGPSGRKFQQIMVLAPDWNIAAIRAWTEGAKAANPMMSAKASDGLYRTYLVSSALTYLGAAQFLQQKYTGENIWDKEDWTYVDRGDGTKIQLNKHFMEVVHLINDPKKFGLGKMSFLPTEALDQLTGSEYVSHKDGKTIMPPMKGNPVAHALKHFFTPISVSGLMQNPESLIAGNLGMPISGTSYKKQAEAKKESAEAKKNRSPDEVQKERDQIKKRLKDRANRAKKLREAEKEE